MPIHLPYLSVCLEAHMAKNNVTQVELSRQTEISPHQIKAMLAGEHTEYTIRHVMKFAELFGVTIQEVLERGRGEI